jgi:hypothetical protein
MQVAEAERRRGSHAGAPYRLLSLLISTALLIGGSAVVYHRIAWRDVAAIWTSLDPTLVAIAMAVYWRSIRSGCLESSSG